MANIDFEKLRQLEEPVELVLSCDLEKLRRKDEAERVELWNQIQTREKTFEREFMLRLDRDLKGQIASKFTLAKLLLATAASVNDEDRPIIAKFNNKELALVREFEGLNVFDVLTVEEIADRMARRKDIHDLAMKYQKEYSKLDSLLEAQEIQKDLKLAFNKRYRERLNKVVEGVQAYVGKYGFSATLGQVGEAVEASASSREPERATGYEKPPEAKETDAVKPKTSVQGTKWWQHPKLNAIIGISMILVSLLGFKLVPFLQSLTSGTSQPQRYYSLTTQSIPGDKGTIQVSPMPEGNGKYQAGTRVKLEARPEAGASFIRWSVDAQGTMPSFVITMDSDKQVIAEFR